MHNFSEIYEPIQVSKTYFRPPENLTLKYFLGQKYHQDLEGELCKCQNKTKLS